MTRQDVFRQISEKTGLGPLTSRLVLESFFEVVKESLIAGKSIYIGTFGRFLVKHRGPRIGRNINQNTAINIAAHVFPSFKPSPAFVSQVKTQKMPFPDK